MSQEAVTTSVIVPTRNRPEDISRCVRSLLEIQGDRFEIIVVDQSDEPLRIESHPRLRLLRSATRGKSAALNEGIAAASGELLAFTDDDCTVPAGWLRSIEEVFAGNPRVDFMFGDLDAIEHDPSQYFVPVAHMGSFEVIGDARRAWVRGGAGACMAARRRLFAVVGGFDEKIGPGSEFRSCEEFDLYYRVLAADRQVARVPSVRVLHWGARPYADGSGRWLLRWYAYGEGAVVCKHLRLGDRRMLGPAARIMMAEVPYVLESLRRGRLSGLGTWCYKWRGLVAAIMSRTDSVRRVFV